MKPSLDIIIVNWNAGKYLSACLSSILSARQESFELKRVVVVDNASSDESAANLHFSELPLTVIRNPENRGFAVACNQGAKESTANYLLFLNPDTVLLSDSLVVPLHFMEQRENAGIGISGIQLLDEEGNIAKTCSPFPTPSLYCARMLGLDRLVPRLFPPQFLSEEELQSSRPVDQIIGAFMLIRRDLFEQLKGFDERFFLYFDDVDIALRSRQLGYTSYFLSDATACHAENKCTQQVRTTSLFYYLRSRVQYTQKHFGVINGIAVLLATLCFEPVSRFIRGIFNGSLRDVRQSFGAYARLWREMPWLLLNRG